MAKNAPIRSNRRKELVEATISVIAQYGYHGTTVSRVAKEAGVSVGLMNFHFETKDKLFEAVFKHLADEYQQVWQDRILASDQSPWPLLQTMIATYFDREVFNNDRLSVWFAFWSDPALRDKFRDAATAVERRYVQQLELQVGHLLEFHANRDWAARNVTSALSAMIDGFWLQALLYPKRFKAKDAVTKCTDFIRTVLSYHLQRRELAHLRGKDGATGDDGELAVAGGRHESEG
jgi:TetR/AcrR family transcriptional repressor of bet genes